MTDLLILLAVSLALALLMAVSCFGQKKKSIYDFTVKDGQTILRFEPMRLECWRVPFKRC